MVIPPYPIRRIQDSGYLSPLSIRITEIPDPDLYNRREQHVYPTDRLEFIEPDIDCVVLRRDSGLEIVNSNGDLVHLDIEI